MSDIRIISQRTGEFISEDAAEPGFIVNMGDDGAQAFIERIKATNPHRTVPAVTSTPVPTPVAETPEPTVVLVDEADAVETTTEPVAPVVATEPASAVSTPVQAKTPVKTPAKRSRKRK